MQCYEKHIVKLLKNFFLIMKELDLNDVKISEITNENGASGLIEAIRESLGRLHDLETMHGINVSLKEISFDITDEAKEYLTIENREKLMDWYDSWYHSKLSWPMITEMWIIYDRLVVSFEE